MGREYLWRGVIAAALSVTAAPVGAQQWNDARTRELVERATTRRALQLADTALTDYRAHARGYVSFLAQVGEGLAEPPRIVKADELALEVYWRTPGLSKQRIVGRRDTLLLPTDIEYHRDHLGIVQNDFPSIIRLGDGDEVSDVPHPLSPAGLDVYDFAISDSMRIGLPGRDIRVYEVKVRPRDDRQPRVIGAVYIDPSEGQVVRMAFNFTRAAFLDRNLEDLAVVLENGLVATRFWLPRRQEIEIRRRGTWLEYPVRGIIRGRWEVGGYEINTGTPADYFSGPEIVFAPPAELRRFAWDGAILDSLPPDVLAATAAEVRRVQAEARALVRGQALARARTTTILLDGFSDAVRFTSVEGLALGGGVSHRPGSGLSLLARGRYGTADGAFRGELSVGWERRDGTALRVFAGRALHSAGDAPERSGLVNSVAAQEFGSDYTDLFDVRAAGLELRRGTRWRIAAAVERDAWAGTRATPVRGAFLEPLLVAEDTIASIRARVERPVTSSILRDGWRFGGSADARLVIPLSGAPAPGGTGRAARAAVSLTAERTVGGARLTVYGAAAALGVLGEGTARPQDLVFLGGPVSAPGYDFHRFVTDLGGHSRIELAVPVPFPAVRLGRFGRSPARAMVAPYGHLAYARPGVCAGRSPTPPSATVPAPCAIEPDALHPAVGIALMPFFEILWIDVARGLSARGRWTVNLDASRAFWGML